MSKGFEVRLPTSLQKKGTYYIPGDPIVPMLYSVIGGITPKAVQVPEITANLSSGSINVINSPCLAAEQLQWAPQLSHINTMVTGYGIGALVFSSAKFKSLPADVQEVLTQTGSATGQLLTKSIRAADDAAYKRLAVGNPKADPPVPARMTAYTLTDAEKAEWNKVFSATRAKLKGNPFDPKIVAQVEAAAK